MLVEQRFEWMSLIARLPTLRGMVKLYFLGGENVIKRDAKEVNAIAFKDAGGAPAVLVFPWARPSFDATFSRRKRLVDYFRNLGASAVDFSEFSDSFDDIASKVARSDLIYLTGGQASTLLSRLRCSGVERLLRGYRGVVVGRSAGAMVLGKNCLVTNRYSGNQRIAAGLGLTDFSVKAHYELSKDRMLKEASKYGKIYAVPSRAAVVWEYCTVSFMGEVFLFENGRKTRAN